MPTNNTITAPLGFRAGAVACGLKVNRTLDVGVLVADRPCAAAAVFTTNRFCGAPIVVGREHIRAGQLRAIVVNSGCSNVATGQRGIADARLMCRLVAERVGGLAEQVLPSSTGVIGKFLAMDKLQTGIDGALGKLSNSSEAGLQFAQAIMTTDTRPKLAVERFRLGRSKVTIAGCCKGSGMIAPNMATMLAYLTTDAGLSKAALRVLLRRAVERSFNRVTVDECQSTSDTVAILASGAAGTPRGSREERRFADALNAVCEALAYKIVADGEGATKVLEVIVTGAKTPREAHATARAIAVSPLVKTAVHGGDPNWGRIVQALGQTDSVFQPQRVIIKLGGMTLFRNGAPARTLRPGKLVKLMRAKHVTISIDLRAGRATDRVLTCDLSRDYIAINADYHT